MNHNRRRGFTLIELLMVAAAATLLMATLLPAVQQARDKARETLCRNNLKQIGLALHNYHDAYLGFAPGWMTRRQEGEGHPATGWQVCLLPYLDQGVLYNQLETVHGVYQPTNGDLSPLKQPLPVYHCPLAALDATNPLRGDWGTSTYSGNYGSHAIPRWAQTEFWPGQIPPSQGHQPDSPDGVFFVNSFVRIRDMTDGTSNTLFVGERCVLSGGGIWPGPRSNFHENDAVTDASHVSPLNGLRGFSSRHSGVVNFGLADGSARSIRADIESRPDLGTLQKLAGRNDGQVIEDF